MSDTLFMIGISFFVLFMLILDLKVLNKEQHVIKVREALIWTSIWVSLAALLGVFIYYWKGIDSLYEYAAGYLMEESLSVDNLFVFLLVFNYFKVPSAYQHKVLFWGIIGAASMRAVMIIVGAQLIQRFHWIIYIFGAFLIFTGIKLFVSKEEGVDLTENKLVIFLKRYLPILPQFHGDNFWIYEGKKRLYTPLFVVLIVVEATDLMFALDSIPAVFGVTSDISIAYSSNLFAILGLRSLYFAIAGVMELFHFLKYGLAVILTSVGVKMIASHFYKIPIQYALGFIALTLVISILASIIWPKKSVNIESPIHLPPDPPEV